MNNYFYWHVQNNADNVKSLCRLDPVVMSSYLWRVAAESRVGYPLMESRHLWWKWMRMLRSGWWVNELLLSSDLGPEVVNWRWTGWRRVTASHTEMTADREENRFNVSQLRHDWLIESVAEFNWSTTRAGEVGERVRGMRMNKWWRPGFYQNTKYSPDLNVPPSDFTDTNIRA